jgi:hypothetical protein
MAAVIVDNRYLALMHAAAILLLCSAIMGFAHGWRRGLSAKTVGALSFLVPSLAALDQLTVSGHYVQHVAAEGFTGDNALVRFLKEKSVNQRVYLLSQDGAYNTLLSIVFPYHNINAFNAAQMARMPEDYQRWLQAMGRNLPGLWSGAGVGLVLGPATLNQAIRNDPVLSGMLNPVFAYNMGPSSGGGLRIEAAAAASPGQHVVYQVKEAVPRYALVGAWDVLSDEDALRRLAEPGYRAGRRALIAASTADGLPPTFGADGPAGSVEIEEHRSAYARLKVSCNARCVLRSADKFTKNWSATVDGAPAPLRRCDFIAQGVVLDAGIHQVEFVYRKVNAALGLQWCMLGIAILCGLGEGGMFLRGSRKAGFTPLPVA